MQSRNELFGNPTPSSSEDVFEVASWEPTQRFSRKINHGERHRVTKALEGSMRLGRV